jgi:MoaA/NifB/PqqE/SkfB family radical SAM enzyme
MPILPQYAEIAVTNRCNARCRTCNIWQLEFESDSSSASLPRAALLETLSDPAFHNLVELVLTGGEPFLRADLPDLVQGIAALRQAKLKKLRTIVIPTNGLLAKRIADNTETMAGALARSDLQLVIDVSLNALDQNHDRTKGAPGAYSRALDTLRRLDEVRVGRSNLFVGVNIVVTPETVEHFERVVQFAKRRGLFWLVSPLSISPMRFRNAGDAERLRLSECHLRRLAVFYRRESGGSDYCFERIARSYRRGRRQSRCVAGAGFVFIDADGAVYPCPLAGKRLGNIRQSRFGAIWKSDAAQEARTRAGKAPQCRQCLEFGSLRITAVHQGFGLCLFLLARCMRQTFRSAAIARLLEYGLDKYLVRQGAGNR